MTRTTILTVAAFVTLWVFGFTVGIQYARRTSCHETYTLTELLHSHGPLEFCTTTEEAP